ncbi:MAG: hypothetical protein KF746_13885 [Chitinophagaceae bacterium]|nr:hypothetical protein [Chitinophagaceae bacterium]
MKRRNFIGLLAIGTAGIAAGGYIYLENFDSFAKKIIRKDTAALKIAPEEYDKFFKAVAERKLWNGMFPQAHKQLLKWHYYIDNGLFKLPYTANYTAYRSKIVGAFLLSTDFFQNRMNESIPVKFTALYDPYLIPCSNPFSDTFYPELDTVS